jgi:hypothetical protein
MAYFRTSAALDTYRHKKLISKEIPDENSTTMQNILPLQIILKHFKFEYH